MQIEVEEKSSVSLRCKELLCAQYQQTQMLSSHGSFEVVSKTLLWMCKMAHLYNTCTES